MVILLFERVPFEITRLARVAQKGMHFIEGRNSENLPLNMEAFGPHHRAEWELCMWNPIPSQA